MVSIVPIRKVAETPLEESVDKSISPQPYDYRFQSMAIQGSVLP
jgi:hypothetical protein